MKKLYYTVEKETEIGNEEETVTGNKTIAVYDIINNEPKSILIIECGNEENSQSKILEDLEAINFKFDKEGIQLILL